MIRPTRVRFVRMRALAAGVSFILALSVVHCGARSGLLGIDRGTDTTDAGGSDAGSSDAVAEDRPPMDGTSPDAISPDAIGPDAAPPPPCQLVPAGDPTAVMGFPDRHAEAPSMVVLDPGTAGQPASIALQFMTSGGSSMLHPDTQVAQVRIDTPWPEGLAIEQGPTLVGIEAHGWAEMARAPGGRNEVGFAWHGDPGGTSRTMFRTFDLGAWSAGPTADISTQGEAALSLAEGMGTGDMGMGWGGDGYAVVWREYDVVPGEWPIGPAVAVLDPSGNILLGPHRVAGTTVYPGRAPRVVWSGSTYVMATAFTDCPDGDDLCAPASIVVTRVRPASGDAWDDSGVDLVAIIPAMEEGTVPRRPFLTAYDGHVYAAWAEGVEDDPENRRAIRVVELNAMGEPTGKDRVVAPEVRLDLGVTVTAGELGVLVVWGEIGDESLPYNELGRELMAARRFDLGLEPIHDKITMPTSSLDSYGWPWAVTLTEPKSLLLAWGAIELNSGGGMWQVFLGRFDCVDPSTVDAGLDATVEDAAPDVEYGAAIGAIGALDRFVVYRRDFGNDTCTRIGLAAPMEPYQYDVVVTEPYAIETASVTQHADVCDGPLWDPDAVHAIEAHGTIDITLGDATAMPCEVSADVQLVFGPDAPAWAPSSVDFSAEGVEVAGGCEPF